MPFVLACFCMHKASSSLPQAVSQALKHSGFRIASEKDLASDAACSIKSPSITSLSLSPFNFSLTLTPPLLSLIALRYLLCQERFVELQQGLPASEFTYPRAFRWA